MKTNLFPIALFALLVAVCNEEPEQVAPITDSTDLACQVQIISNTFEYEDEFNRGEGTSSIWFSYNADKSISKINGSFTELYCYTDAGVEQCENFQSASEYSFTYTNGIISDVTIEEDGQNSTDIIEFTYLDNRLTKVKFSEDGYDEFDEFRFIYGDGGKLEKLENWDNYSGPNTSLVLYGYDEFIWTANNVTTVNSYSQNFKSDEPASRLSKLKGSKNPFEIREMKRTSNQMRLTATAPELSYRLNLVYDSNSNPLFGNLPYLIWDGEFYSYLSQNNPSRITEIEYYDGTQEEYINDFTYSYNEKGFPTTITNDGETLELTYNCD
ncbi:hypothetical protein [Marivirga sp.]|uniref:hypothetical protein n=1 Tax=Marivirga sp. TaxID=2018662 RepID=UPI002D7E2B76|nr:hypothetical protein [Marivirga sp.]HET8859586.1 hypothetical protein [Marivirga sp.]